MKTIAITLSLASLSSAAFAGEFDVPAIMSCRAQGAADASAFTYVLSVRGMLNTVDETFSFRDESIELSVLKNGFGKARNLVLLDRASAEYDNGGMGHFLYNVPASINGLQVLMGVHGRGSAEVIHTLAKGAEPIYTKLDCVTEAYDLD